MKKIFIAQILSLFIVAFCIYFTLSCVSSKNSSTKQFKDSLNIVLILNSKIYKTETPQEVMSKLYPEFNIIVSLDFIKSEFINNDVCNVYKIKIAKY